MNQIWLLTRGASEAQSIWACPFFLPPGTWQRQMRQLPYDHTVTNRMKPYVLRTPRGKMGRARLLMASRNWTAPVSYLPTARILTGA